MNIFKTTALVCALIVSLASCKRDYKDNSTSIAPTNISATSSFTTGPFASVFASVDFSLGIPQVFTATFSEVVTWKIVLTGQTSTATKTISATSSVIDVTNSSWTGNHDGLYFFETGETVTADLIISGIPGAVSSITFTVLKAPNYRIPFASTTDFMLVNLNQAPGSTTWSDFETVSTSNVNIYPYLFNIGAQTYAVDQTSQIKAPEGKRFMRIIGTSTQPNGFFVGGLQCRVDGNASSPVFPASWTDPTKIYLNVYVRGIDNLPTGCKPVAFLNFECHEDDRGDLSQYGVNCNTVGAADHFCPATEDSWVFKIPIKHVGWRLFSAKYSDLYNSEDYANGGNGNKTLEPQKVRRVQFGLVSSPPFNQVSADFDFACFTYGAPYNPNK
jgi:hypothetical protein